jgi:hypothetical protein
MYTISFSTPVSDITFPFGSEVYQDNGTTLVKKDYKISGIVDQKTILVDAPTDALAAGTSLVAISANPSIEGDQMRDYYLKIRLSHSSSTETELYAVNAVYAKSNLHNELGQ